MMQILYLTRHLSLPGSHVFLFSVSFLPSTRKITLLLFGKLSEHCRALRQRLFRTKVPIVMALNVGSSCLCGFNTRRREIVRVRAVASEDLAPSMTKEEKVKLGGSDLKVTRLGIGAWSWGDTSYWNNFEWDECWSYGASYHPLTWMPCMHEVLSVPTCIACPRTPKSLKPTAAPKKGFPQLMSLLQSKALRTIVVLDHKQQPGAVGAQTVFDISDRKMKAAKAAFDASVDGGITFFDTAEVYGSRFSLGAINSETLLGRFIKERKEKDPEVEVAVATKFAALPWRLGRQSVLTALKDSLCRLGLSSVELYQLHWPGVWGNEGYIDGLGDAVEQGLVKAVGVSNYSERRLRDAYERLKKRGIPLASNQVNYSLIYRAPEENGVKAACDELGITLIAYSPIAQGVLTGKYKPENPPSGPRGRIYTPEFLTKLQPLLNRIQTIGDNCGKTPTQVVLNWLMARDNVVPIPGAKNAEQAKEFAGALGWRLSNEEINELRSLASDIKPVVGFPVEKL